MSPEEYLELVRQGKVPKVIRILAPQLGSEEFGSLVVEQPPAYVTLAEESLATQPSEPFTTGEYSASGR